MVLSWFKRTALSIINNTKFFYTLLCITISIQICSLQLFMHPWFDEVFYADISMSVASYNEFILNLHPLSTHDKSIFIYGPLFFYMQAFFIKNITLSPFLFRLPVYLFGTAAAIIFKKILFIITNNKILARIFLFLFFSNLLVCGSLSCGRMEMMALFFAALSLLIFFKRYLIKKVDKIFINVVVSGILFSLAVLTTPRSSFLYLLFAAPLFEILIRGIKEKKIFWVAIPFAHLLLSFGIPYFTWYYPHIGNPAEIFNYITPAAKTQISFVENHVDINSFAWLLISLMFLLVAILRKIKLPNYLYGFFISCLLFVFAVIPWSFQHGMIVPVLILTALMLFHFIRQKTSVTYILNFLAAALCIQLFFTALKYTVIWIDLPARNSRALEKIIQQNIPEGSKVMGSYTYYYACINNHCQFRSAADHIDFSTGKKVPAEKKVNYLMNVYKGEYIILRSDEHDILSPFLATNKFKKIASVKIPPEGETFWEKSRVKVGLPEITFYNGEIYKRVK